MRKKKGLYLPSRSIILLVTFVVAMIAGAYLFATYMYSNSRAESGGSCYASSDGSDNGCGEDGKCPAGQTYYMGACDTDGNNSDKMNEYKEKKAAGQGQAWLDANFGKQRGAKGKAGLGGVGKGTTSNPPVQGGNAGVGGIDRGSTKASGTSLPAPSPTFLQFYVRIGRSAAARVVAPLVGLIGK